MSDYGIRRMQERLLGRRQTANKSLLRTLGLRYSPTAVMLALCEQVRIRKLGKKV